MELKLHSRIYLQGTASSYSVELRRHVTHLNAYSVFFQGILISTLSFFSLRGLSISFVSSEVPHKILDAFFLLPSRPLLFQLLHPLYCHKVNEILLKLRS